MWFIKIKKKKGQYLLLALISIITVMLISTCATFTVVSNTFAKKFYSGDETPDITLLTISKEVADKTSEWYRSQTSKVKNLKEYESYSIANNFEIKDKSVELNIGSIIPIKSLEDLRWKVSVKEGDKKANGPKVGDIWLSNIFAKSKNIKVGDEAIIKDANGNERTFKVGAIVNDSTQPSTLLTFNLVYINKDEVGELDKLPKVYLTTFNCGGDTNEKSKEISKYINKPIEGGIMSKSVVIMAATLLPNIIGGIGLLAACLIVIVLIIILRSNLWNFILKEYKSIGIYKAMGFSDRKIKGIYLKSYVAVALISSFIGCVMSIPIIYYICNIILKYLGEYKFDLSSLVVLVIVFVAFNVLVTISLMSVLRRVNKIKPVTAINIGLTSSKAKLKKSIIKDNSSSFAMAINDIFKYKKNNILMLTVFTVVFYMLVDFVNMKYCADNIENNMHNWVGVPKCNMNIIGGGVSDNSLKEVIEYLKDDERVKKAIYWDTYNSRFIDIDNSKYDIHKEFLLISLYNDYDEEYFSTIKGRNPKERNEVALTGQIMKKNNLHIGDYITLNIRGNGEKFLITGQYGSKNGNGQSMRLKTDVIHDEVTGNNGFITLKDKKYYDELKNELQEKFQGLIINDKYSEDGFSQVKDIMEPVIVVLIIGIVLFSIANLINIILTNNIDNRKNYGIMKSMGFSNKYIRNRIMFRILILSVTGALLGGIINISTSRQLFMIAVGDVDGYMFSPLYTGVAVVSLSALIVLIVMVCCRSLKKTSAVELIVE